MTHGQVAKKVRLTKEAYPERYCPTPGCLWRTNGGGHCPKHAVAELLAKDANVAPAFKTGLLLSDKHVERCVTLLALMQTATNTVELQRFQGRHAELLREHPELHQIRDDDPRVEASLVELRAAFAADERIGEYDDTQEHHARCDR